MELAAYDSMAGDLGVHPGTLWLDTPRRVLVAHGDARTRSTVAATFEDDGWVVTEVRDVDGLATSLLFDCPEIGYSLVVVSLGLPGGSALDVLRTVQRAGRGRPFILLAETVTLDVIARAHDAGAIAILDADPSAETLRAHGRAFERIADPFAA